MKKSILTDIENLVVTSGERERIGGS